MKTKHVLQLLTQLGEKENQPLDHYGFGEISKAINTPLDSESISQRYLYDLFRKTENKLKKDVESSSPRTFHIDLMVKHLGFSSLSHFTRHQEERISDRLKMCCGNWWSIVRANSGEQLFKAPVQIAIDSINNKVSMELRSSDRVFRGEVNETDQCLTAVLKSNNGKWFSLIFKLGNSTTYELLQGVFCGISSAGDPISGREILLREDTIAFDEMKWEQLKLEDENTDPRILNYFKSYSQNCIKTTGVSTFTLEDLAIDGQ